MGFCSPPGVAGQGGHGAQEGKPGCLDTTLKSSECASFSPFPDIYVSGIFVVAYWYTGRRLPPLVRERPHRPLSRATAGLRNGGGINVRPIKKRATGATNGKQGLTALSQICRLARSRIVSIPLPVLPLGTGPADPRRATPGWPLRWF